ncbi:MAG: dihydrodipicolinate synthase family protein [Spirochaetes bacterium]|nr:dihydrodipicolinate synthase family protein [Spirochaetota bacterium]
MNRFRGVYAAMLSPFEGRASALSLGGLESYCHFLAGKGADGLFPFGTTGEWPHLGETERMRGAEVVVKAARSSGRDVKVIIHAGAHTTEQACRLCSHAQSAGADGAAVIAPPYYPLDEDALFEHFTAVAKEAPELPVFIYAIPGMTRSDITPALLLRIRRAADNVAGIKYSGSSIPRLREYRKVMGDSFALFIGDDSLALPALHEGADGIVSGNASAVPDLLATLYRHFTKGDYGAAAAAQSELDAFIGSMDESAELSCFKNILAQRGVPVGDVRPPLKRLSPAGKVVVAELVRRMEERGVLLRDG